MNGNAYELEGKSGSVTLAIGIIGSGGIARRHATILEAHEGATVEAVCDLDAARADELAALADAEAYTDHCTLLRETTVDAVYITTPPQTRVDIISDVAEWEIPIFCEKPLAATIEDGRAIEEIVDEHDIPFMIGFCSRFWEPCRQLFDIVDTGGIGEPITVFSERAGYGVPEGENWRIDPDQACGITIESASHNIDLLRWLGGEVVDASGRTTNVTHPELDRFDDNLVATVQFDGGAIGTVENSWTSHNHYLRHGVIGTEGAVIAEGDGWWRLDTLAHATEGDSDPTVATFDSETATEGGYIGETDAFVNSVADGATPPVDIDDGLRALEVSHEILGDQ